jgi:hypothetical protein
MSHDPDPPTKPRLLPRTNAFWRWALTGLELLSGSVGGGVLGFLAYGMCCANANPHGRASATALLIGMSVGLALSLALVVRRATRSG